MSQSPLRVLIVDDSADDAELMARALQVGGFDPQCLRVHTAEALSAALTQARWWDLITCDVSMPDVQVADVLASVHAAIPTVPVVVVTGRYPSEVRRELGEQTANGFVSKQCLDDLPHTVRAVLRSV